MKNAQTWRLTDHLCKACGGRILQCASNCGITGGGNPVFKCASCGASASGMGPDVLCWCGFSHRGQRHMTAYRCVPFSALKEHPELERHFRACGCDPEFGEVGIVLERDYVEAIAKAEGRKE